MEETSNNSTSKNKRYFSASGSILLPLALKWRLLGFLSAAFIATFVVPCITAGTAFAAAKIELTIPKTLSLSVNPDGQLHSQQSEAIKITSDAYAGYTFTLNGNDTTKQLKNGTTAVLNSITAALDASAYGNTGNLNTWGYLPSKLDSAANTKYQPGPTTTPVTIEKTTTANTTANEYTITLGAKVDGTLPAGSYENTFTLTVTANDVPYTITYDLNSGIGGPTSPQKGTAAEDSTVVIGAAPTRQGYEFKGWCDKQTANETCSGNTYQPEDTYTLTNSANNVTLYAMWQSMGPMDLGDLGSMQSFACSDIPGIEDHGTVTDSRNNVTYTVAKLKDGLCWMTQNLAIGSNSIATTLHASDSDVASDFTLPVGTNAKSTASDKSETGGWHYKQYDTKRIWISTESGKNYGGYYSWFAATAGEGTSSKSSGDTEHSICPKGWRLPTSAEITTLTSGGNSSPNKTNGKFDVYAGFCDEDGCPRNNGSRGYWWSSTANNSDSAYYLYANSSSFYLLNDYKGYGSSVRCVARQ